MDSAPASRNPPEETPARFEMTSLTTAINLTEAVRLALSASRGQIVRQLRLTTDSDY